MPVITRLDDAAVRYGDTTVTTGLDLELEQGELFTLVGASGAGKSTVLRLLAGLEDPTSGSVSRPTDAGPSRLVFQDPHLLPWRSVAQNVRLGLEYRANAGLADGKVGRDRRVGEILTELGIADLAHRRVDQLSGGQAQRVAIARAVVAGPSLLLLDEPFGALDPHTRADLQDWLLDVHRTHDLTTVLVTHDTDEALLLGDRIGLLTGSPSRLTVTESTVRSRDDLTDGSARATLLAQVAEQHDRDDLADDSTTDGTEEDETDPAALVSTPPSLVQANRREFLTIAGAAAVLASPLGGLALRGDDRGAANASSGSAELRVGYLPITDAAPLLIAHDAGEFADRGIATPDPVLYRGWAPLVEAFQAGNVDIVHLLMPLAVQLRYGAEVPAKVLLWNHTNGSALAVANDVDDVADLAGTTVAIPSWFSVHNVVLQQLLRDADLEAVIDESPGARQVRLVVIPPADMVAALEAGSIAGYIVAEPFCAVAEVQGIGKILRFTGDVWKDHACCVTVVREDLVTDRPDVALRAAEAIVAAQQRIRADRPWAARRLSEGGYLPQPLPAIERTLAEHQDDAYVRSGAVQHEDWDSRRIDFQPYPYPTYTGDLVDAMRETVVDADVTWLDRLRTADVHDDLVATSLATRAIDAEGGLAAFDLSRTRTEVVEP